MENNNVVIKDINLAAVLETFGFHYIDMQEGQDRYGKVRFNFVYEANEEIKTIMDSYWADEQINVAIHTLFQNLKLLKSKVYNLQNPQAIQSDQNFNDNRSKKKW